MGLEDIKTLNSTKEIATGGKIEEITIDTINTVFDLLEEEEENEKKLELGEVINEDGAKALLEQIHKLDIEEKDIFSEE